MSQLLPHSNPLCQVFPCGRKPNNPEKTHDFRQSVYELFQVWADVRYRGGGRLVDWATEAPINSNCGRHMHPLGAYFYLNQKLSEYESSNRTEIDQCLREYKHFLKANVDRTCINRCRWFSINLLRLRKQRFWRPCWRKTKSQAKEANEIVLSRRLSELRLDHRICAASHCWVRFLNFDILGIISLILMCYFVVFQSENIPNWIFLLLFCCKWYTRAMHDLACVAGEKMSVKLTMWVNNRVIHDDVASSRIIIVTFTWEMLFIPTFKKEKTKEKVNN